MAKDLKPNEMIAETAKAKELANVTKSGKGTPMEARFAKAVLEQARLGEAAAIVTAQIENSDAIAAKSIEKSVKDTEKSEMCVRTLDRRHQLNLIGNVSFVVTVAAI